MNRLMVDRSYMVKKAPPPSAAAQFVNQHVLPHAIDGAGALDMLLNRMAHATRRQPVMVLAVALGAGWLLRRGRRLLRPRMR